MAGYRGRSFNKSISAPNKERKTGDNGKSRDKHLGLRDLFGQFAFGYSFIKRDDKTVVRSIVAKSDIDAENQCQSIIKATKNMENIEFIGER
jgi:hypothetical protein